MADQFGRMRLSELHAVLLGPNTVAAHADDALSIFATRSKAEAFAAWYVKTDAEGNVDESAVKPRVVPLAKLADGDAWQKAWEVPT